jgi:hypothetical protein
VQLRSIQKGRGLQDRQSFVTCINILDKWVMTDKNVASPNDFWEPLVADQGT